MTEQFKVYGDWEATPDTLVEVRDPEYYKGIIEDYKVFEWCRQQEIRARRQQTGAGLDIWSIPDQHGRVLFALRWG